MKGYTTDDVANLLGLPPSRIRSLVRSGVLTPDRGPRGEYHFDFQDLVLLRTAASLERASVPAKRIVQSLARLRSELPAGRSLTEVHIRAEGDDVVVSDGRTAWHPASGQIVLEFRVADFAAEVAPLARKLAQTAQDDERLGADEWYRLGAELEAVAPAEARDAYHRALELQPTHADAHVNLGRLLHEEGRASDAAAHYRQALASGGRAVAAYNLGVALEDLRRPAEAIDAYCRALELDEHFAEAHYNLARLYEQRGNGPAALRHYRVYRDLTGSGSGSG